MRPITVCLSVQHNPGCRDRRVGCSPAKAQTANRILLVAWGKNWLAMSAARMRNYVAGHKSAILYFSREPSSGTIPDRVLWYPYCGRMGCSSRPIWSFHRGRRINDGCGSVDGCGRERWGWGVCSLKQFVTSPEVQAFLLIGGLEHGGGSYSSSCVHTVIVRRTRSPIQTNRDG